MNDRNLQGLENIKNILELAYLECNVAADLRRKELGLNPLYVEKFHGDVFKEFNYVPCFADDRFQFEDVITAGFAELSLNLLFQNNILIDGSSGYDNKTARDMLLVELSNVGPDFISKDNPMNADGSNYNSDYIAVLGTDLTGGEELYPWMPRLSFLATKLCEVDFLLDKLLIENERRKQLNINCSEYEFIDSKENPIIVLMIDELADLIASKDGFEETPSNVEELENYRIPRNDAARVESLRSLAVTGGEQGIYLYVSTNHPSLDILSSDFAANFTNEPSLFKSMLIREKDIPDYANTNAHKKPEISFLEMPADMYAASVMSFYKSVKFIK